MTESKQKFYVKYTDLSNNKNTIVFDNNQNGYDINSGVTYIELGKLPITVRYADYDKMFKGAITVIIQHAEQPAEITVSTMDNKLNQTLILGGTPDCNDVGVFRLFIK